MDCILTPSYLETFSQIEALLGDFSSFGVGSRILVTTRDKEALAAAGVYETYEPRCLNHNESLELFMKHAFRTNQPSKEYSDLSNRAIEYAQGLPLALKILGASLYDKSIHQWKELLEKIKTIPQRKIMDVLRTSFEGLDDLEKDIFLDIACFFSEWDIDFVIELLDSCGFFPCSGLRVLADRAIITTEYNELVMHDLLQEMGREIVRLESTKEPGKRSRLWSCEDVNHVLTQNTATDAVECLILDLSKSKVDLCIHTGAFVRMTKLRLLMIYYSFFNIYDYLCYLDDYKYDYIHNYDYDDEDDGDKSCERLCPVDGCKQLWRGDLEYLSQELRFLLWHGCPLKSLPSTFIPTNLVRLDMRGSHIQQLWEGIKPLPNLKVIMLSHCQYLVKIPDLTEAINLEGLFLDGCSSLIEFEFHSCIYALQNLRVLDLKGCKQLKILPSFIHMKSLRILRLSGCSNLEKFPEISVVMTKLRWLYLDGTPIKELSLSINNLTGLRVLNLGNCTELKILPSCIHMKSLRILRLSGCSNLEKFPEISVVVTKLKWLYLDGTPIKELSSSINNLTGLRVLNLGNCTELKTLPTSIHMSSLRTLKLDGCSNLEMFPEISGIMEKLPELCLDETAIKGLPSSIDLFLGIKKLSMMNCKSLVFLPDSINNLTDITHLDLQGCTELKTLSTSIHMSSLQILNLNGCSNLEKFPEISGFMRELSELHLDETAIKGLPSSIDLLEWLVKISMRNCKSLVSLPDSICNLVDLTHLDLYECSVLHNLPEKLGDLGSLQVLDVGYSGIKQLPFSILRLRNLRGDGLSCIGCKEMTAPLSTWRSSIEEYCSYSVLLHLDLSDCNLLELSDGIAHLSSLKTLKLCRNNLESVPVTMNQLRCLRHLELEDCKRLKSIPELSSSIKYIDAHDCTALETVSTPKTRNFDFRFSNCFRLVQANFRDIVETHSPDQDNHLRPVHFKMWLPGSEVPEWFKLQGTGCSVTFQVPPNSFNNKLLGFDICIVIHFSGAHHDVSNMYGRCYWTSREYDDSHLFKFDLLGHQIRTHTFLESDHLFMGYLPFSEYHWIAEDRLDAFQIVVETGTNSPTEDCFTSSCGVRLIYANHWEGGSGWPDNGGCGAAGKGVSGFGAPFFPDQLEIRKCETQSEAESSELGEGRHMPNIGAVTIATDGE